MIDFSACDTRLIEKIAFALLASRLNDFHLELQHFLFIDFIYLLKILFQFIRHESRTGSFHLFFFLINSMRHRRKQNRLSPSSSSFYSFNGLRMKNCFLKILVISWVLKTKKIIENEASHVGHYVSAHRRHLNDLLSF